jgi:CYTH domain-containing protein
VRRVHEWRRSPGAGRYARPEVEQRFLATEPLPDLNAAWPIEDRYVDGTSLRLRRLEADGEIVWKLTQKVRPDPEDPSTASITNIYLRRDEYELLTSLPAAIVRKSRSVCLVDGVRFVIDVFDGALEGLRLAEVEVDDRAAPLALPAWLGREVTHDDRFAGGRLARTSAAELATLLAQD